ncbi:MAG: carbohydrate kinase family protein [Candidatus Thorarchaeota archaeon]|nr:carbohydrate kinase family protein [Candidatus Thorarchaeota archaeon]
MKRMKNSVKQRVETDGLEIVVVGHLSRDLIITPEQTREALGGGPAYTMIAPHIGALGTGIVTRVGSDFEQSYIDILKNANLDLTGLRTAGKHSTRFINEYDKDGERTQRVEFIAPEIRSGDLLPSHLQANTIHFSPLLNEIHPSCVEAARSFGALVSVDVQGYTRYLEGNQIIAQPWHDASHVLKNVDVVKCNRHELEFIFGMKSELGTVTHVLSLGPRIVVVTKDQRGSTIYTRNSQIDIPLVLADAHVDSTGSGDTYIIGFLLEYMRTGDVKRSGLFGATCASFNVESVGPSNLPTRDMIERRMRPYL